MLDGIVKETSQATVPFTLYQASKYVLPEKPIAAPQVLL
jgi:hypothetical protein